MTIENIYTKIINNPAIKDTHPLLTLYVSTYEAWITYPNKQNLITSLYTILNNLKKEQPNLFFILLEDKKIDDLELPHELKEPEWVALKKAKINANHPQPKVESFLEDLEPPTFKEQTKNFVKSMMEFASSGFETVSDEVYQERKKICSGCQFFDPQGFGGIGKCRKCGCSAYKLNIAASVCPINLWPRATQHPPS